uniref:Uncharacterized protein n=1 Tax=Pyramimonas obovata TaxID=1411642 RepID=A0A7S0N9J3_9CHLO
MVVSMAMTSGVLHHTGIQQAPGLGCKDIRAVRASGSADAPRLRTAAYFAPSSCQRAQVCKPASLDLGPNRFMSFRNATRAHTAARARCRSSRDGLRVSASAASSTPSSPLTALKKFVIDQYLPLGLVGAIIVGLLSPALGVKAANAGLSNYTTTGIFFLSGLAMCPDAMMRALKSWGAWIYGIVFILLISPLAALGVLQLPLVPKELAIGLAVFCCMPTTLTSGVSLTQASGGNTALALGLTVGTNLLGIFTMPFMLAAVLGTGAGVSIDPAPFLANLAKTILAPVLIGALARRLFPALCAWVDTHKKAVSMATSTLLITVPWSQVSKSRGALLQLDPSGLAVVAAVWAAVHLGYMLLNTWAVRGLGLGAALKERQFEVERALVLVCSQKTLPVCVAVLTQLGPAVLGEVGVCVVPCILAHMLQIVLDSFVVSHWAKQLDS